MAGAAVLATCTRGQSDVIDRLGVAARSYAPGDVAAAAAALQGWVDDRVSLEAARTVAWQQGEARYNWEYERGAYLRVIAGVFDRRPGHAVREAAAAAS